MSIRARFNISHLAIKYSRLTLCFWLAIAVAGILAFSSLKYSLFPDVQFPVVVIRAQSNLETLLDTESQVTTPIEESVKSVRGLAQLYSSTYTGQSIVSLLLDTNIKVEETTAAVETNLAQLSVPTTKLEVIPFNLNESTAISYVLLGKGQNLAQLSQIATSQIIPAIARLPGVQRVDLLGDSGQKADSDLPIDNNASLVHFNGQDAIAFQVIKQGDANTLEVVDKVIAQVKELQAKLPDIQLVLAQTPANYIHEATSATIQALWGAIILAILVIFPFLRNWRATLIAAIAIPMSLLGTFIVMAVAGFNLETLTLLALALIIGIVVDDAIVEVENIIRYIEKGNSPREAALIATREIGFTASVSTLTIVAVFLPIAFMGGTLGQFFRPFGLIIASAVLTSLLVARTLSPVLAVYWLTAKQNRKKTPEVKEVTSIVKGYRNLLQWSLKHRKIVIGIAITSFMTGIALIPLIPQGFVPQLDRGEFNIVYTTPLPKLSARKVVPNTPKTAENNDKSSNFSWLKNIARSPEQILLRKTITVGQQIETVVLDHPNVESVYTLAGVRGELNKGKIYVKLKGDRNLTTSQVQADIRNHLPQIPQVIISVEDLPFVETGEDPSFKVALIGEDLKQLQNNAIAFKKEIQQLPGFEDVRVSGEDAQIETINHLDGKRVIYINANLTPEQAIGDATEKARAIANNLLPSDITLDLEGDSARAGKILGEFAVTLCLAVILMLIALYVPFGRWLEPTVIGLSLPLSIVGAMLALLITRSDFGMISLIGLIFLLGLLDKNGILLLDYANQLRQAGMNRTEAILETGVVRLRPIVMTTFSTILGMLPIALGLGAGAELRQPMAVGIIGGLITSSLLSLIVVPVLYTLLEDLRN
ncbi:MAG: efflux RND transporter permease subunit [Pleurocapsa sp.]